MKQWGLWVPMTAMIAVLAGCGKDTVQVPPPPPGSSIVVKVEAAGLVNGQVPVDGTVTLTATVTGDPNDYGVDWSRTCSSSNCGTLSASHTASGQPTIYTPPPALLGNSQTVNVVAFATADHTQNVVSPITITAFGGALNGTYVLGVQGVDSSGLPYQFAGVVTLDGNGGVTAGEQTVNFTDPTTGLLTSRSFPILPAESSYFLGPDGRGTITLNTSDTVIDPDGATPEVFDLVYLSNSQALVAQIPTATSPVQVSATGTMDLQATPPSSLAAGGYAFVVSGTDPVLSVPTAIGGVFNVDASGNIPGAGSVADQVLPGIASTAPSVTPSRPLSGSVSYPSPNPFGKFTLNLSVPGFLYSTAFVFTGYMVDATHIKLVESDATPSSGFLGSTGGVAIGQGSATGTLTNASLNGTYVFGVTGFDLTGTTPNTLTSAGALSADGGGNVTGGFMSTFLQQNGANATAGAQVRTGFDGTYLTDTKGIGHVTVTLKDFVLPGQKSFQARAFIYLTGNGNPPLVLEWGNATYPFLGTGIAYPQSSSPTISGRYGLAFIQQNGGENDGTAQMTVDSSALSLSGVADNSFAVSQGFTGIFQTSACSASQVVAGCVPGILENVDAAGIGTNAFLAAPFDVDYYAVDQDHGFFVETDLVNPNVPTNGQVSFGYYARRIPVCAGCP